jgi:hypothetical protein
MTILCVRFHSTDKLQPLEKLFPGPLKILHSKEKWNASSGVMLPNSTWRQFSEELTLGHRLYEIESAIDPRLWLSGQSSWLQIQRFGLDSCRYQLF